MPSEIEIYGDIVLFGIRIVFQSNDCPALEAALALYPVSHDEARPDAKGSIYIVLQSYDVNRPAHAAHRVEGTQLAIDREGIAARADGQARHGVCEFPAAASGGELLAEMINTMVLFLIGHAGRVPLHASAVLLGDTAMVFAGASGAGKSTLALAASRAGLPVLSDDTLFVQTAPGFRLWSLAGPIHVFEKDAPPDARGGMRFRAGRWKKSLPIDAPIHSADRAILCVLARGAEVGLEPLSQAEAMVALLDRPEPGYEFYGEKSATAARALAAPGAWRLTLSADPEQAIALIRERFSPDPPSGGISFHGHYVAMVAEIERRFAVAQWKSGDVDLWPLARFDLYLDMYWDAAGMPPPATRAWPLRFAARVLKPLVNLWRVRRDLAHWIAMPRPAPVIFLGDGVSLDGIDGAFADRCGEPLIAALEKRGRKTFVMQSGELSRLPWRRATFAANVTEAWGWLIAPMMARGMALPDHGAVLEFLRRQGVGAPSLSRARLGARARLVAATAWWFQRVLRRVKPKLAFVVSYYAGLGPGFVLACRREGIFCTDLQHAPLEGAPMAYRFGTCPERGYATLPALFWTWTQDDAAHIGGGDVQHRTLVGGHLQLASFLDDNNSATLAWDAKFPGGDFAREIVVALQPIAGRRAIWEALAAVIEAAPRDWRWWIRRHPASRAGQDAEFGRLLTLAGPNVMVAEASLMPLPALLRQASVLLSLASGAAREAAMFGVPVLFLSEEARGPFGGLIERGAARIVRLQHLQDHIAALPKRPARLPPAERPDFDASWARLEKLAQDYPR